MASSFNFGLPTNQIVDRISQVSASAVTSGVIYVDRENETLHRSNGITWTEIGNLTDLTKGEFLWKLYNLTGTDEDGLDVTGVAFGDSSGRITSDATKFIYTDGVASLSKSAAGYAFSNPVGAAGILSQTAGLFYGWQSADTLELFYNGTRQLYINSSGRVNVNNLGVGSTTGAASSPQINFGGATNVGLYLNSGNGLAFATSGVRRFEITYDDYVETTLPFYLPNGSVTVPANTFTSDTTTGLYKTGSGFAATVSGTKIIEVTSDRLVIPDGTIGIPNVPAICFVSALTTGIAYRAAAAPFRGIANIVDGNLSGGFRDGGLMTVFGSAASPAHAFVDATGTLRELGMYAVDNTTLGFAVGGTQVESLTTSTLSTVDNVRFISDTDTGISRTGTNEVSVTVSGVDVIEVQRNKIQVGTNVANRGVVIDLNGAIQSPPFTVAVPTSGVAIAVDPTGIGNSAFNNLTMQNSGIGAATVTDGVFLQDIASSLENAGSWIPMVFRVMVNANSTFTLRHNAPVTSGEKFYLSGETNKILTGGAADIDAYTHWMAQFVLMRSAGYPTDPPADPTGFYQVSDFIKVFTYNG